MSQPTARAADSLACHGRITLRLYDAQTRLLVAQRRVDNLIVTSGLSVLATALNYGLIASRNTTWGNPYATPGDTYGAVGTSTTPAASGQTSLVAEVGRAVVSNAAVASAVLTYDAFFPTSLGNGILNEVGWLGSANLLTPSLTSAVNSGSTYTTLAVQQVVGVIPSSATLILGYGTGTTQTVTTTAQANPGDTSIAVSSFTAAASFAAGSLVAYAPGTLIDRAVLGSPVTKTAAQTMTLELQITLAAG